MICVFNGWCSKSREYVRRYKASHALSPGTAARSHVSPLQGRHNELDGVSNHQPYDCYSAVYSSADQRNIRAPRHWPLWLLRPVNSPHKGLVTWKMFLFDDVIMSHWLRIYGLHDERHSLASILTQKRDSNEPVRFVRSNIQPNALVNRNISRWKQHFGLLVRCYGISMFNYNKCWGPLFLQKFELFHCIGHCVRMVLVHTLSRGSKTVKK